MRLAFTSPSLFVVLALITSYGVQAVLRADLDHLKVTNKKDKYGHYIRRRGKWKYPDEAHKTWEMANELLDCLIDSASKYNIEERHTDLMDKYYGIKQDQGRFANMHDLLITLSKTDVVIFGDNHSDPPSKPGWLAYVWPQYIAGERVAGMFFTKNFSNRGTLPAHPYMALAAILLHESVHYLLGMKDTFDFVQILNNECKGLNVEEYTQLKRQAKAEKNNALLESIHCVYWKEPCHSGWVAVHTTCPEKLFKVPDATAAAAYECVRGQQPSNHGSDLWTK